MHLFPQSTRSSPIQHLDGLGAGIFRVLSVLVIADLTRGAGRFNLAQALIATAVGIGAATCQAVAGTIVLHAGYNTAFLTLAAIAAVATPPLARHARNPASPSTRRRPARAWPTVGG